MQLYVARQPIFDKNKVIVAFEMLHRESSVNNSNNEADGDYATSSVIASTFLSIELSKITDDKPAYVNFTESLLLKGIPLLLPKEQFSIEILETVEPTQAIIDTCHTLKTAGYTIVLDDFVLKDGYDALAALADVIKVDFINTDEEGQREVIKRFRHHDISFLAEKVETEDDFNRALDLGYTLFQGYFFAKPVILETNSIPVTQIGQIRLMQAINEENPDFGRMVSAIENDVALSLETIKLVNSAYFARRNKIASIKDAVVTLGIEGVKKWVNISALYRLGTNKPDILIVNSIIRSKFMELMAKSMSKRSQVSEYSMLGLFSLLDAITNCSFEVILCNLNIAEDVNNILVHGEYSSVLGKAYKLMLLYERGDWDEATTLAASLNIRMEIIADNYMKSLQWNSVSSDFGKAARS